MNSNDFKKLLDESLKPIKNDLNKLKYTIDKRVLPSVTYIKTNIKAYKDSYQINNSNAKKLEKRVKALEKNVGITTPPDLTLAEVN